MKHYCKLCNKQVSFNEYRIAVDKHEKVVCKKCAENEVLVEKLDDEKRKQEEKKNNGSRSYKPHGE